RGHRHRCGRGRAAASLIRGEATAMNLADVDLYDLDRFAQAVPHDVFAFLRVAAPVFWHKEPKGGPGFWAVTKYDDVATISKAPHTFCSARGTNIFQVPDEQLGQLQSFMLNMDPPAHSKYRRLVSQGFT